MTNVEIVLKWRSVTILCLYNHGIVKIYKANGSFLQILQWSNL